MLKKLIATFLLAVAGIAGLSSQAYAAGPPSKPIFVDVDEPVLNDFEVTIGQKVYFITEQKMKSVAITGKTVNALHKKTWPAIIRGSILSGFQATNAGTAKVEINTGVVQPNGQPQLLKLNVKVVPTKVSFTTVEKGWSSGFNGKLNKVIKDDAEWNLMWTAHASNRLPAPAAPQVDFQKEMVVAVYMGTCSSGGYSVQVLKVEDDGTNLVVYYRETQPAPGGISAAVMSHPHHLVKLPLTSKPVVFKLVP